MASVDNSLSKTFIELPEDIRKRFTRLFDNEEPADIYFILGKAKKHRIPGHKVILSDKNDVFKTMFFGSLPIKSDEIEIPDIETTAFLTLLHFLYFNEAKISCVQTALSILYAAKKYILPVLEKHCVEFLKNNVDIENAFCLLTQGRFYDKPELIAKCLDVIDKNTIETLESGGFTDIDLETLICVLKRDTLQIFESKLFKAMVLWAEAECSKKKLDATPENQRFVLGSAINLIRYDLMTLKAFIIGPFKCGLLDYNAVKQFSFDLLSCKHFVEKPRCSTVHSEIIFKFRRIPMGTTKRWISSGQYTQHFKVEKPIIIVGYITANVFRPHNPRISLYRNNKKFDGIAYNEPNTLLPDRTETITFTFDRPILLTKDEEFKVDVIYQDYYYPRTNWRPGNGGEFYYGGNYSREFMGNYFQWGKRQNEWEHVVSEIIFYEY